MSTVQMRIRVKPEEVAAISQETLNTIDNLKSKFDRISEIVNRSGSYWEAEGQTAYIRSYHADCDMVESTLTKFQTHVQNLQIVAGVYKAAEREAVQAAESLECDVII